MALVLSAHNVLLFLLAWEMMALSSFLLVILNAKEDSSRKAGWMYLVTTHIGTAFLLAMFLFMAHASKSMDFSHWGALANLSSETKGILFILAIVGFGAKADFMPFHAWMPEAYPNTPCHVSAILSGVMTKVGIYALLRILSFLGLPPVWWGWTLVVIGIVSGILGILFALAQSDLTRLLAYSTVENIGIITMGIGISLLGVSYNLPALAAVGAIGTLLHILNHGLYKALLFLSAGAALCSSGTRNMNLMGGLFKRMKFTGFFFLIGSVAICGLPPLNGFISEFLIYFACFTGALPSHPSLAIPAIAIITALALIGGLAIASFSKAFGMVFLGEPRQESIKNSQEVGWMMKIPMGILALSCILSGFLLPCFIPKMCIGLNQIAMDGMQKAVSSLYYIGVVSILFILLLALLILLRSLLLYGRKVETAVTWDCGYARPTTRMQYTGTSFSQILVEFYSFFLRFRQKLSSPKGLFPEPGSFSMETPDLFQEKVFSPLFIKTGNLLCLLHTLQHGRVHLYVLYIILALIVLLLWKL